LKETKAMDMNFNASNRTKQKQRALISTQITEGNKNNMLEFPLQIPN